MFARYSFPKGQAFFLSRRLALDVGQAMVERRERLLASDASRCYLLSPNWAANNCSEHKGPFMVLLPYEDAWIGYAISQSVERVEDGPVMLVHLADRMVMDYRNRGNPARPVVSPRMISWHSRQPETYFPREASSIDRWFRSGMYGCADRLKPWVDCGTFKEFESCGGQRHQPCMVHVENSESGPCDGNKTDLVAEKDWAAAPKSA